MNYRCRSDGYYRTADFGGPVSLYIHYPFCVRKCRYCDFLSGPADEDTRERYLETLCEEIRRKSDWFRTVRNGSVTEADTVFFGGGTPSLMTPRQLDHLMYVLSSCFLIDGDAEITMECNPGTADYEKLRAFRRSGVNRLSIGIQSFQEKELRLLGRIHSAEQAGQCVRDGRRAGFANISLDLMSALPGQDYGHWMSNLREAVRLEPEHISAYSLILEDGTPLKAAYEAGELDPLPEEELDRRMYHDTARFLETAGLRRYEISNYAHPGFESRHNSGYWKGHPYLGLGLGAASYLIVPGSVALPRAPEASDIGAFACTQEGKAGNTEREDLCRIRWSNPESLPEYLKGDSFDGPVGAGILTRGDQMEEFMFLGLRRMRGVREADFEAEFGCSMEEVYGKVLRRYCDLGLLYRSGGYVALTERGIDVSNTVMADFLL